MNDRSVERGKRKAFDVVDANMKSKFSYIYFFYTLDNVKYVSFGFMKILGYVLYFRFCCILCSIKCALYLLVFLAIRSTFPIFTTFLATRFIFPILSYSWQR